MRRRRVAGVSALEVVISASLGSIVIGGGIAVTSSSSEVARSSATEDSASRHVEKVLRVVAESIRRSSRSSLGVAVGSPLANGATTDAIVSQEVLGYSGAIRLDAPATIRFVRAPGAETGDVVRTQSGVDETIARGITSFAVARSGDAYTIAVAARSGPDDDRGRGAHGAMTVAVRNP